jgi:hypothetical protein
MTKGAGDGVMSLLVLLALATAVLSQTACIIVGEIAYEVESRIESKRRSRCFETGRHGYHLPDDPEVGRVEFLSCNSAEHNCAIEGLSEEEIGSFEVIVTDNYMLRSDRYVARTNRRIFQRCAPLRIPDPAPRLSAELAEEYSGEEIDEALFTCSAQFRVMSTAQIPFGPLWTDGEYLYYEGEAIPVGEDRHRESLLSRLENGCLPPGQALPYSDGEPDRVPFHPETNLPYELDEYHRFSYYWTLNGEYYHLGCPLETEGELVLLDYRFAIDDVNVFYDGWKVPGADRGTFEITAPSEKNFSRSQARDSARTYASTEVRAPRSGLLCDGELCLVPDGCQRVH